MSIEITEFPNGGEGPFRRFVLNRKEDHSGVSGTGVVAHGVQFPDGAVVLRWSVGDEETRSTVNWSGIDAVKRIHGHDGSTTVEWVDDVAGLSESDHEFDHDLAFVLGTGLGAHAKQVLRDVRELAALWRAEGVMRSMTATTRSDCGQQILEILDRPLPDYEED